MSLLIKKTWHRQAGFREDTRRCRYLTSQCDPTPVQRTKVEMNVTITILIITIAPRGEREENNSAHVYGTCHSPPRPRHQIPVLSMPLQMELRTKEFECPGGADSRQLSGDTETAWRLPPSFHSKSWGKSRHSPLWDGK